MAAHRRKGIASMTDDKDQKTTITLEPGQIPIVLGMKDGQISRQLFASPEVNAMLDDERSDIPLLPGLGLPGAPGSR